MEVSVAITNEGNKIPFYIKTYEGMGETNPKKQNSNKRDFFLPIGNFRIVRIEKSDSLMNG